MNPQTKRVAIVTAAGRGMGKAIATELGRRGYQLVLLSPGEGVLETARQLDACAVQGSVTSEADIRAVVELAIARHGRIDAVVNHTGHPPKGDLLALDDAAWQLGHDMVIGNVIKMARAVTPWMQKNGGGAFVNISTYAALEPTARFPVSCVYRAALAAFAKLYADQYGKENIRMNNILPGFIDSLNHAESLLQDIPMQRFGSVQEIASTAAFLLSADAGYITGQNIRVDGGITRHV